MAGVSIYLMVNCLGFLFVWWWTAQQWIIWGFCLSVGELAGVSVCPAVNSLMVNCLGFLFVWWWTAQWWIVWGFCLSSGKQPDGELFEVSVCPVTVVNCLSSGELPTGCLFVVVVCLVVNCPMVNCLGFFCLSSGELLNGELSGVSVGKWWTVWW